MAGTFLDYPYHIDGRGRSATTAGDDHVRDMIEQILFTDPNERVMRPDFGCGLKSSVFKPNSVAAAAATQTMVKAALQRWLQTEIEVQDVQVDASDSTLSVTVVYKRRSTGELTADTFRAG